MFRKLPVFFLSILFTSTISAQPFADIVSFSYQSYSNSTPASDIFLPKKVEHSDDYFLNFFLPKQFASGNTFLLRLNTELLNIGSTYTYPSNNVLKYHTSLASVSLPVGMKLVDKSKKWETILMVIPKIASDFGAAGNAGHDYQLGGIALEQCVISDRMKIKAGLYYNREAFGNFFVPLIGLDLRITDRFKIYGVMPTNYRAEYAILKDRLYAGLGFKSLTRSFNIRNNNPAGYQANYYIRYDEMQIKAFVDFFAYKKFLVYGEAGYSLGKPPLSHNYDDHTKITSGYPTGYLIFNAGIAYRVRLDLDKQ